MCGIAGVWSKDFSRAVADRLLSGLQKIRHRGPDDVGVSHWDAHSGMGHVGLGLARLAILDLSAAGHQPMSTTDGRYTISFNGEITNYLEIRQSLVDLGNTFVSDSDTEVLLTAWSVWGHGCLERLEGMYAFAILDKEEETLTLVRDVFGIKPLFYSEQPDSLAFCSELVGLYELIPGPPRLDWQAAVDYLLWAAYDHTERSFVEGVRQLAPAHSVTLDLRTGRLGEPRRYWWPVVQTTFSGSIDESAEIVRGLFLESVRRNLRSDVPVGVALSGGIDSSAIVGAIRHLEPTAPIQTFSFVAPGFEESEHEWIDLMVRAVGAQPHAVSSTGSDLFRDLDAMILAQGEPFGSTSIYAQYRVFQSVRENGVVVTLDGQGGDEAFAGYHGYPAQRLHSLIETGRFRESSRFVQAWAEWPGRSAKQAVMDGMAQFMPAGVSRWRSRTLAKSSPILDYAKLRDRNVELEFPLLFAESSRGNRVKSHLRAALTRRGLPALLRHGDRNSMHFSIESRVPFLDRALVEFALSLPEDHLIGADGTSKNVLRRALRGIVPDQILDRRDKVGFSTPEQAWLSKANSPYLDGSVGEDAPRKTIVLSLWVVG